MPILKRKLEFTLVVSVLTAPIPALAEDSGGFSWRPDFDFVENPDIGDNTSEDFDDVAPSPDQDQINTSFDRTQYPANNYRPQLNQPLAGPDNITSPPNEFSCSASVHDYSRAYIESFQTGPSLNSKCGFQQLLNLNLMDKFSLTGLISGSFCGFARSIVNPAIQAVNNEITRVNTYIPSNAELSVNGTWELTDTGPVAELSWNLSDDADYYNTLNNREEWAYDFEPESPNTTYYIDPNDPANVVIQECMADPSSVICQDPELQNLIGYPTQPTQPTPTEPNNPINDVTVDPDLDFTVDIGSNEADPGDVEENQSTQPSGSQNVVDTNGDQEDESPIQNDGSISWGAIFDRTFGDN